MQCVNHASMKEHTEWRGLYDFDRAEFPAAPAGEFIKNRGSAWYPAVHSTGRVSCAPAVFAVGDRIMRDLLQGNR